MSKRTGLFLTWAAFGLIADAQLVMAQQASSINGMGNRAQSGMVTYNQFFQAGQSNPANGGQPTIQTPRNTSVPPASKFVSTRQEAPHDLTLQSTQPGGNLSADASLVQDLPSSLPTEGNRFAPSMQNPSLQNPNSSQPGIASVPAGTASCDSAVSFYDQPLVSPHAASQGMARQGMMDPCDAPVGRSSIDESEYQQSYKNRQPIDYDSKYYLQDSGPAQHASIYEQVTNQFNQTQSDDLVDDCGCESKRPIYFGGYTALFGLPYYSDTQSATSITNGGLTRIEPFDYDLVFASRFNVGFETAQGPGGQLDYFNMSANSNVLSVGQPTGATNVVGGLNAPFATPFTIATPTGGRLDAVAQQDLSSFQVEAFKRIYWPISTLSGGLGLDYTTLDQRVNYSSFSTPTDTVASANLNGQRRFQGLGPTFSMQYSRPIGHTHLSAIGGIKAGLLFGSDDWAVLSDGARIYEAHASRVVSTLNVQLGVEYSKALSESSSSRLFVRTTVEGQNWLNMGSFASTNSDFGFISGNLSVGLAY